ncbi:MAG: hypothetical protein U0165_15085 [Polyangiaceae bacterium]
MNLTDIERAVASTVAAPLVVPPRILRRVLKRHCRVGAVGEMPHVSSLVLPSAALMKYVDEREIGRSTSMLPERVILIPKPEEPRAGDTLEDVVVAMWRELFHASIHLDLEAKHQRAELNDSEIAQRIEQVGQTEFDEIRYVLRQDHRLLPPFDDRTTFIEFAATFLELRQFDDEALNRTFPGLLDKRRIEQLLSHDLDVQSLLARARPAIAPTLEDLPSVLERRRSERSSRAKGKERQLIPAALATSEVAPALLDAAKQAANEGNNVRAMLIRAAVARVGVALGEEAEQGLQTDLNTLADRLHRALTVRQLIEPDADSQNDYRTLASRYHSSDQDHHGHALGHTEPPPPPEAWPTLLRPLVERAASRAAAPWNAEARLLYDLQKACVDNEREASTIDLRMWMLSFGKIPLRRVLPAQREIRVLKYMRSAASWVPSLKVSDDDRRKIESLTTYWADTAEDNLRAAVRPVLTSAFHKVGLKPTNTPESVSRNRMVEELVDQISARGFFSIQQLRDAVSRSELKLPDLRGAGELFRGDPLLLLDEAFSRSLDGVYRRGEIYLRGLQKVSSLAFGTRVGRFLVLYAILPLLSAFTVLEGLNHLVHAIGKLAHAHHLPRLLNSYSFPITAAVIFFLIHSLRFRDAFLRGLSFIGTVFKTIFVTLPHWFWHLSIVQAIVESQPVALIQRLLLKPLSLTLPLLLIPQIRHEAIEIKAAVVAGGVLLFNVLLNTPQGTLFEETFTDWILLQLRNLRHRVLPGLFALVADLFRSFLEHIDRLIYVVDELLRFRQGDSKLSVALKAVAGLIWFFATYLIRIYVNLLIEPQINPIKHFPVVTVSHKIILPLSGQLIVIYRAPLMPLGPVIANTIAGATVVLTPGVFGFLTWEFKENWKLYTANRSAQLSPLVIGHHGETIAKFLRPGFHSGTVPKIYSKLRRARDDAGASKQRAELHHVEEALRHFASRELEALLEASPRWSAGEVTVGEIEISSNRIRIGIECASLGPTEWVVFEEHSGWVLGSATARGWLSGLDAEHRSLVEAALAGFFKQAGVDMVREQISRCLPEGSTYDIAEEGLVVWPDARLETRLVYPLSSRGKLVPKVQGPAPTTQPPELDPKKLLFKEQAIDWKNWVAFWEAPSALGKSVYQGPPLLAEPRLPRAIHSGSHGPSQVVTIWPVRKNVSLWAYAASRERTLS